MKIWTTWRQQRVNRRDMAVLGCLVQGDIYVVDMWDRIGGNAALIHVSLDRLTVQGYAWSGWAEQPDGRCRRRYGTTEKALDVVAFSAQSEARLKDYWSVTE